MFGALLTFSELPKIGFAHHFYVEKYHQTYGKSDKSFELVYIKAGEIIAELYGERFRVEPGSLFVLFRQLPIRLSAADGSAQSHCSVQLTMDYQFSPMEDGTELREDFTGLALPFVAPPCAETERMKNELYSIVSMLGVSREKYALAASLTASGILARLDGLCRRRLHVGESTASLLEYKIKRYVTEHLHQKLSLHTVAEAVGKTPNYLNSVFKKNTGSSIHQYIGMEKTRLIGELMENKGLTFPTACENVAISDISYGYRLFKKHMGITPGAYLSGVRAFPRIPPADEKV